MPTLKLKNFDQRRKPCIIRNARDRLKVLGKYFYERYRYTHVILNLIEFNSPLLAAAFFSFFHPITKDDQNKEKYQKLEN
jgi:hypothetical protein